MTHTQELDLERFANLMVEMIERHADVVDKQKMQEKLDDLNSKDVEKSASFVVFWFSESYNKYKNSLLLSRRKRSLI